MERNKPACKLPMKIGSQNMSIGQYYISKLKPAISLQLLLNI